MKIIKSLSKRVEVCLLAIVGNSSIHGMHMISIFPLGFGLFVVHIKLPSDDDDFAG